MSKEVSNSENLMKIPPVGVELFHAKRRTDGWTDRQTDKDDRDNSRERALKWTT